MKLTIGPRVMITRLLALKFSNYRMVLTSETPDKFTVASDVFMQTVKRATLAVSEHDRDYMPLNWTVSQSGLVIVGTDSDGHEASELLPIESSLNGESVKMRIAGRNLLDFLALVEGDVTVQWGREGAPVKLTFNAPCDYQFYTQPLRIK